MDINYSFNIIYAKKYGVNEAIMINNLIYWIIKNKANNKHFYEGRTWTYNSHEAFSRLFPFWDKYQVRRIIDSLVEQKVLIKGNFNKIRLDRTMWYSFNNELAFLPNGFAENDTPIPNINTDSKPNIKKEYIPTEQVGGVSDFLKSTELPISNQSNDNGNSTTTNKSSAPPPKEKKKRRTIETVMEESKAFYDHELSQAENKLHPEYEFYKMYVEFIFGNNKSEKPMYELLEVKDQLSFRQYIKLSKATAEKALKTKKQDDGISPFLKSILTNPKYIKGKVSIYLTFDNWLDR